MVSGPSTLRKVAVVVASILAAQIANRFTACRKRAQSAIHDACGMVKRFALERPCVSAIESHCAPWQLRQLVVRRVNRSALHDLQVWRVGGVAYRSIARARCKPL